MIVKEDVLDLICRGISLNRLSKITGINKSTLYYHYRRLFGKKYEEIKIDETNSEKIGEFIGIFAGDGNYTFNKKTYHHRIRIYTGAHEIDYSNYLKSFLSRLFNKSPRTFLTKEKNVVVNLYYSKEIYGLIMKYLFWEGKKTYTVMLKDFENLGTDFIIGFLRGLFGTDGGIYAQKNKVAFGTASKELASQIRNSLRLLGIEPGFYKYKDKPFWYIDMYGERSRKFMELIEPNNPSKILYAQAGI